MLAYHGAASDSEKLLRAQGDNEKLADWLPGAPAGIDLLHRYTYQEFYHHPFSKWTKGIYFTIGKKQNERWSKHQSDTIIGYRIISMCLSCYPNLFDHRKKSLENAAWRDRLLTSIADLFVGLRDPAVLKGLFLIGGG